DEKNYATLEVYKLAEWEYDNIMYTAFADLDLDVNSTISNLNRNIEEPVTFKDVTYYVYDMPDDFLYLNEKPDGNILFGRNRIYYEQTTLTIKYCRVGFIGDLTPRVRKYLEYVLAYELASPMNRGSAKNELHANVQMQLQSIKESQIKRNKQLIDRISFDFY
ncbi:MAG: hypothetical protein ACRC6E_02300, partial [Fusobacteriaceae bacterium]